MRRQSLTSQASNCRHLAGAFPGGPERNFLLHVACEFHRIAETERAQRDDKLSEEDDLGAYYARRAAQHTHAAVLSPNPAAQAVHYELAARYFELVELESASDTDLVSIKTK